MTTNEKATIKNFKTNHPVWYHPNFITNILSLAQLKEQYRVTYDSTGNGAFEVHIPGKENLYFHCYSNGLHLIEQDSKTFSFIHVDWRVFAHMHALMHALHS